MDSGNQNQGDVPPDIENSRRFSSQNLEAIRRDLPKRLARQEEQSLSRVKKGKGNILDRLALFYASVDEVISFVMGYTPCKRGCCDCCHLHVDMFPVEATYLEHALAIQRDPPVLPIAETHGMPCPFLLGGQCAIYQYRPYACRKHMIFDQTSYWCQPRFGKTMLPLARFSKFDEALAMLVHESGNGEAEDIRNVFPLGLWHKITSP